MIKKLYRRLLKPYPLYDNIKSNLIISFIVFLVLAIFHPFGLAQIDTGIRYIIELGYGIITFLVLLGNTYILPKLFPKIFTEGHWKVYHEIIYIAFTIFCIGLGNTIYAYLLGFIDFNLLQFISFLFITIIVSIFPITVIVLITHIRRLKHNLKDANAISRKLHPADPLSEEKREELYQFQGQQKNDAIEIIADNIYFIKSQKNYLEFYYQKADKINKKLVRGTLKKAEKCANEFDFLQRCHRSYIVNINHIRNINGNSLGYALTLDENLNKIPVSRSYTKKFKKLFTT